MRRKYNKKLMSFMPNKQWDKKKSLIQDIFTINFATQAN